MARQRKLPPGMVKRGRMYYAKFRSDGRLVQKRLSTNLDDAIGMLNDLRARAFRNDFGIIDNDVTLDELRPAYERHCRLTLKPRTVTRYQQALNAILAALPVRKVTQLSDAVVNTYREDWLAQVSPRTVNIEVKTLTGLLAWAVKAKRIGSNPLAKLKALPTKGKERKLRRAMTVEEVLAVFEASPDYLKPCWRMLATTGIRRQELATLTFSDVDFERAVVTIRAEHAKTGRAREIPLDEEMLATIRRLNDEAPFRRPGKGATAADTARIEQAFSKSHVFVTNANTPWGHRLLRRFYAICKRVGIEDARPAGAVDIHAFRGTFTTLAIDGGANPKDVQTILGHSTLEMTMNAYAKSTAHARRAAISALPFAKAATPEHVVSLPNVSKNGPSIPTVTQTAAG